MGGVTLSDWDVNGGDCPSDGYQSSATVTLTDGSGYTLVFADGQLPMATVYAPSGDSGQYVWPQYMLPYLKGWTLPVNDPNNNTQSYITPISSSTTTYTDTLGATLTATPGSGTNQYKYTGPHNTPAQYTVTYTQIPVYTQFGCQGIGEYLSYSQYFVTEIDLPDYNATTNPYEKYTFTYEPTAGYGGFYTTGRLGSITLPTGQEGATTISYSYSGSSNNTGMICADGTTAGLARTTIDGTWTYTRTENSSTTWSTNVQDPAGNQTAFSFVINNGNAYETQRNVYSGSSNLVETVNTCYNGSPIPAIPCVTTPVNLPIVNQIVQVNLPGLAPAQTYTVYKGNGLPQLVDEYTYGPTFVRETMTCYASLTNQYINDRPSSVLLYNTTGNPSNCTGTSGLKASTTYNYDSNGNLTQETRSTSLTSTISRGFTYGSNGVLTSATDFNGNTTTYGYNGNSCNDAFPTSITTGGLTTQQTWDCNGGVLLSSTDPNGQTTTYSYDSLWRLIGTTYPDNPNGISVATSYPNPNEIDTTTTLTSSSSRVDKVFLDGLGRVINKVLYSDPAGPDTVTTAYDALGRVASVTNPYRSTSDSTYGATSYNYDPLNRLSNSASISAIVRPDNSVVGITYSGNCATNLLPTTTTDEALKVHTTCTDALGRVTSVTEDSAGLNPTTYTYDALNNLTGVSQGGQTRTFTYDFLSRLTSASNPEANYSGTQCPTTYSYDGNGNMISKITPQEDYNASCSNTLTTTYAYDDLNRLKSRTTPDGWVAHFYYDETSVTLGSWQSSLAYPLGRLTHTDRSWGGTIYAATVQDYDKVGRTSDYWQCTPLNCGSANLWWAQYQYDLAGDITSYRHPAGFQVYQTFNPAQQIQQVVSSVVTSINPGILATGPNNSIQYMPWGALSSLQNTCTPGCTNNPQETYHYNKRLQADMVEFGTSANPTANSCRVYNFYQDVANPTSCAPPNAGTMNNGNVWGYYYNDNMNAGLNHTATYHYDGANRLSSAVAAGNSNYTQYFTYDAYGNMSCTPSGPKCVAPTYNPSTNQITSYWYFPSGNVWSDSTYSYDWDNDGHMTQAWAGGVGGTYWYNALGQRMRSVTSSGTTDEVYGAGGNLLWRYTGNSSDPNQRAFVPFQGRILAEYYSGGTIFDHPDEIGSATTSSDYTGNNFNEKLFYPFGEAWTGAALPSFGMQQTFAQLPDYDPEADLYNTPNRRYSPSGRWPSPDTVRGDLTNPQSLNLYSYVTNNPTTLTDPSGQCGCGGGGGYGFISGGGGGWGWGGGCGGGGFGGGGGGRGTPPPPPTIPIPGVPTISTPGGSFPNPFTQQTDQPPSPLYVLVLTLPLPPFPPMPPGGGGGGGGRVGASTSGFQTGLCPQGQHPALDKMGFVGCLGQNILSLALSGTICYVTAKACAIAVAASIAPPAEPVSVPSAVISCPAALASCFYTGLTVLNCYFGNMRCVPN